MSNIVNNLSIDHIDEISNIWIESIPYNIKSIIGKKIVKNYVEKFDTSIVVDVFEGLENISPVYNSITSPF